MKKIICLLGIISCIGLSKWSIAQNVYKDYWDGQLYLKLKNDVHVTLPVYDAAHPSVPKILSSLIYRFEIYSVHPAFPLLKTTELQHTYKILFHEKGQTDLLIKTLGEIGIVEYAEKIPVRRIVLTPNDPLTVNQYAITNINAQNAWSLSTGRRSVKVAIVDDEVRLDHEDLTANRWVNPNEIPNNGIDDDGDGYIDDVNGYDVADMDPDPNPPPTATNSFQTHGTHCAGIADAVGNNSTGIASIGFGLSLIGVKCNPDTITSASLIYYAMEGVQYAIAANADVISMSWGGDGFSITDQNVFDAAWAQGIVMVAAAGNNSSSTIFYPAGYNHIVSVGSTTNTDVISGFSDFGSWVSVMAPGSGIYSTLAGSNSSYGYLSGTSMATPMVAGLCGLIKSYDTLLTNAQIVSCLESSCDNIDAQNPGFIGQMGSGRINAFAALQCSNPVALPVAQFTSLNPFSCTGTVSFTNMSLSNPTQWFWNFGDGDTSEVQNPTHTYSATGHYTIRLIATNGNGSDTSTRTDYVVISLPTAPVAGSATICGGTAATLNATGADSLYWFTHPSGGTHVAAGPTFVTPALNGSSTFYVESDVYSVVQSMGPTDSTFGTGSYFRMNNYHDLRFDCYTTSTLLSVKVYAETSGSRTITLIQNGVVIQSATMNIPAGVSIVPLHFSLPAAFNLELGMEGNVDLFRNDGGAAFPYTIPGLISINGTNAANTGFYYYFYDWQVQASPCISTRIPVDVSVVPSPIATFTRSFSADTVLFTDGSVNATSRAWNFGDTASGVNDTSTMQNPIHLFSSNGLYNVCLRVSGVMGCSDSTCQLMLISTLGSTVIDSHNYVSIFPNPTTDLVTLSFSLLNTENVTIELVNTLGQRVYSSLHDRLPAGKSQVEIVTANLSSGVYQLLIRTDEHLQMDKLFITR